MAHRRTAWLISPRLIDPRLILGQKDFDALPKREQYLRMSKYVDAILGVLEDRSDPVNWNDADKANLQNLSRQNLSYRTRIDGMMADCDLADRVGYLRTLEIPDRYTLRNHFRCTKES